MRTTIDLPDPLLRQVKARAALEGVTLKELITSYVLQGLQQDLQPSTAQPRQRSAPPMIAKAAIGKPIPALSASELTEVEIQEDLEKYERSTGR